MKALLIIFSLFSSTLWAQTEAYLEVTYKAERITPIDYTKITNAQTRYILQGQEAVLSDIAFELKACNTTYYYAYTAGIDDDGSIRKAASLTGGRGIYYRNDTLHFRQTDSYGEPLNISLTKERFGAWEITDEQKDILGYTCFKAIAFKEEINNDLTTRQQRIVAWFAPELNFPAGPQGVDELPGLVLEASENGIYTFRATALKLDDHCKEIEVPKKGKTLTKEEYDQFIIDRFKLIKSRG